jgi:hypothetical protein
MRTESGLHIGIGEFLTTPYIKMYKDAHSLICVPYNTWSILKGFICYQNSSGVIIDE